MRILAIDVGTGTQDILLFDSRLGVENAFKLVLPSPTMIMRRRVRLATRARRPIVLVGSQMGGGPVAWAVEAHARSGLAVYAAEAAALTLDDDLGRVAALGIQIVSDDEVHRLGADVLRLEFRDLDLAAISDCLAPFDVSLGDLDAIAVAAFDHGAAPPAVSDRQFRFDYLRRRISQANDLGAFASLSADVPPIMSRLRAIAESGSVLHCPFVLMDSAPAAVLGATLDPIVAARERRLIVNIGNFHTIAFRLNARRVEALFEHHTGEIDLPRLESLLRLLAAGSITNEDVFEDMGHGALVLEHTALELGSGEFDVVVTGPRRSLFGLGPAAGHRPEELRPYFAVPFGDMMLAGCFGILCAAADLLPALGDEIRDALAGRTSSAAPWDID